MIQKTLSDNDLRALLVRLRREPLARAAAVLSAYAGLRLRELGVLRWEDVDFTRATLRVPIIKRPHACRVLPMGAEVRSALKRLDVPSPAAGLVFGEDPRTLARIVRLTRKAARALGLPCRWFVLRATAAARLLRK